MKRVLRKYFALFNQNIYGRDRGEVSYDGVIIGVVIFPIFIIIYLVVWPINYIVNKFVTYLNLAPKKGKG